MGRALLSLSSCRFLSNAISENSSLITLFKYLAVEASKIGSVFLTLLRKQHRESLQMNPLLQDALRSSLCFPGFLPGHRLSCYPLSLQQVQPHMLQSSLLPCLPSATALRDSAEQEALAPPASWACRVETGLSRTQGQGAGLGHCCPLSGPLIFISPISQFVNDIFKSSVGSEIVSTISSFFH